MPAFNFKKQLRAIAPLLLIGAGVSAHAATLSVNCGASSGLTSINAAIKLVQSNQSMHPATINVSGACHENVVIQSIDRLTLNAVNGASVTDASGGNLDVILIGDSRSVSVNNFTINGSAGGANGITCRDGTLCRLNGNTIQGAVDGDGVAVGVFSQVALNGGTLQNNGTGLFLVNGASGSAFNVSIQNNGGGIELRAQSFLNTNATITNSSPGGGVFVTHNSTLNCVGCQITGNGVAGGNFGVILRRNSSARIYAGYVITGNGGGGVLITEESSAYFATVGTVKGNIGTDVICGASFTTAKGATTNIGGGSTNCVEPVDPSP